MISLTASGGSITFTFSNNSGYLQNGAITVPVNSLTLVTDNSGMFTFKKSATNDIFISGLYSDIGMTKSELESFYKENMVGSTGGGGITSGEVQSMINESTSGLVTVSDNEVAPYIKTIASLENEAHLSWGSTAKTYAEGADTFETTYGGDSVDRTTNITIKNESGETVSGNWNWPYAECGGHICSGEPSINNAVSGYVTVDEYEYDQETGGARIKFGVADGWKIVQVNNFNYTGYDKGITLTMYQNVYEGGQSKNAIEDYILPELESIKARLTALETE